MNQTQETTTELIYALKTSFTRNLPVSKTINHIFKNHKNWTEQQKATFTETLTDIIRYWRLLWFILHQQPSLTPNKLHQLINLNTSLREKKPIPQHHQRLQQATTQRALRESIPDFLDTLGQATYGSRWEHLLHSLNQPAPLILRTNTLKTTKKALINILAQENIQTKPLDLAPDALLVPKKTNIFKTKSFIQGYFEIQDPASQLVGHILNPKPGMRVVDACAGEGGKTLHLSALMKNKGKIIALDTQPWKLTELRRRATRAGADNIETKIITNSKTIKRLYNTADRLLLDVPCSGLGTLRKNPMIKWTIHPTDLKRLTSIQHEILNHYSPILKKGGTLVYSVCSILPTECEQQINCFLNQQKDYQLVAEQRYYPDTHDTDGFYIAELKRL